MMSSARERYDDYNRHPGDRHKLFSAVGEAIGVERALYPGSYIDVAASFVFDDVTYVDVDRRAARFFGDEADVRRLIEANRDGHDFRFRFLKADYTKPLDVPEESFDLLISLYAGFVSEHCGRYLRTGGWLLANNSHGDASMASLDPAFELAGVLYRHSDRYTFSNHNLDSYFIPKRDGVKITVDYLHQINRGIGYTRSPACYLFQRR